VGGVSLHSILVVVALLFAFKGNSLNEAAAAEPPAEAEEAPDEG
jgi:hypothetical protein